MKHILLLSVLALTTSQAFARRCVPDMNGNKNFASVCEVLVTSTSSAECHGSVNRRDYRAPDYGPFGGYRTRMPETHTHPWNRVRVTSEAASCDVDLQECKDLAFRELEKLSYVNNCGDMSVGKSVEYTLTTLNTDGTVADQVSGRMTK